MTAGPYRDESRSPPRAIQDSQPLHDTASHYGGSGGLDVDEELSAFREAIDDLAAKAQELGLDDCSLLAGDDADTPEVGDE